MENLAPRLPRLPFGFHGQDLPNLPPCFHRFTAEAFPLSAINVMASHAKFREPLIRTILHLPRQDFHL